MSNQVYFGKSVSSGDTNKKIVYMKEMPEHFNEGDLLAVFFTHRNTASMPSVVFKVGSTQQEVSIADDEGILIKSHDVDVEKEGLWGDGETVLFCFVQRPNENTNTQNNESEGNEGENVGDDTTSEEEPKSNGIIYLEIIGKLQASEDDYGIVKLNGMSANETLEDWLKRDKAVDDYNAAINVATVKALIKTLFSIQEDEEEEQQPISFSLQWERNSGLTEELYPLGQLSLGNSGNPVTIEIPKNLITQELPKYTGELINNGSDGINVNGEPYITRYIPNDLFFAAGDEITPSTSPRTFEVGNGIALSDANLSRTEEGEQGEVKTIPENLLPYHIRFDNDKLVLGYDQGETFHNVLIRPALKVEGPITTTQTIDAGAEINGTKIYGGNSKPTWGEDAYTNATIVSEGDIYENNDLLKKRYSGKLMVKTVRGPAQEISGGANVRFLVTGPSDNNWEPIGIVGYNVNGTDASNDHKNDAIYANVWECFMIASDTNNNLNGQPGQMQVAIKNIHASKVLKVRIELNVLYSKKL